MDRLIDMYIFAQGKDRLTRSSCVRQIERQIDRQKNGQLGRMKPASRD